MNKNKDLHIRLTTEQMQILKEKAILADMTITEFVIFNCDLDLITNEEHRKMEEQILEDFIKTHEQEDREMEEYYFMTNEEYREMEQKKLEDFIAEHETEDF